MKVIFIESPGKVQHLSAILASIYGSESCIVIPSYGHVRDLPEKVWRGGAGIEPPLFKPEYVPTDGAERFLRKARPFLHSGNEVWLCSDPDREGEAISWHIAKALDLDIRSTKRAVFPALTLAAVKQAMASPRTIDGRLVAAQEARRVIDRAVGYLVSPELARRTEGRVSSAGSVQSIAVRLVWEREDAIRNFRKTTHYGAHVKFEGNGRAWWATWRLKPGFVSDIDPYLMDRTIADAIAQLRNFTVLSADDTAVLEVPPAPYITSTLHKAASVKLGMHPSATMDLAQALFDKGHITYHRTDNSNLTDEAIEPIRRIAEGANLSVVACRRRFKASASAQAGHPAITPTHSEVVEAGETEQERALYGLIRTQAIASQLVDARYAKRKLVLDGGRSADGRPVIFEASGRVMIEPGWRKLLGQDPTNEAEPEAGETIDEDKNPVPQPKAGELLQAISGEVVTSETRSLPRYSEASHIKKLEAEGIGRPATYAAIMQTVLDRGYVKVVGGRLCPRDEGSELFLMLNGRFAFFDVHFTRELEEQFDKIAAGGLRYEQVVGRVYDGLMDELASLGREIPLPPSGAMFKAAETKARREGIALPTGARERVEICVAFLGPRSNQASSGSTPASEAQIAARRKVIADGRLAPIPANLLSKITVAKASALLNGAFQKRPKKAARA